MLLLVTNKVYSNNNMKKNYTKLIPLFIALPALMGNSPRPQVFTASYNGFKLSYVKEEVVGERYYYTYHLKNTGNGYISRIELSRTLVDYTSMSYQFYNMCPPFNDNVLPPGVEMDITFDHYEKVKNPSGLNKLCEAYATFDADTFISGSNAITFNHEDSGRYYYDIDLSLTHESDDYYYGAILELNYDGDTFFIKTDETEEFKIETSALLDTSKITINNITVIKSHGAFYGCGDAIMSILMILLVSFLIVISMGIFAAIFIPAMVRRKRRNRAKKAAAK